MHGSSVSETVVLNTNSRHLSHGTMNEFVIQYVCNSCGVLRASDTQRERKNDAPFRIYLLMYYISREMEVKSQNNIHCAHILFVVAGGVLRTYFHVRMYIYVEVDRRWSTNFA